MYSFKNDYSEAAHPRLLQALLNSATVQEEGYGLDRHCKAAAESIRSLLGTLGHDAAIHFLCGGTQTNRTAISAFLRPHEAVVASDSTHICVHETGAIEATGHKIITVATGNAKLTPDHVCAVLAEHTDEHMVKPRMVTISQPTEMGIVYSLAELEALASLCQKENLLLYIDGARLGSALKSAGNDAGLEDICRLADAFYIGGTKNGALLGEAIVIRTDSLKEYFRYQMKQEGGLLAKGRVIGVQFEELFRDGLFLELASHANAMASLLRDAISEAGYNFLTDSSTNQIFPILPDGLIQKLQKNWSFYVWKTLSQGHSAIRLVTSWATPKEEVEALIRAIQTG